MQREGIYKAIIVGLVIVIILQWLIIIKPRPKKVTLIPVPIKGKIAIVLDDWGYNLNNLTLIEEIKYPLTISILPNLDYSATVAQELHKRGFEIILHLPMEPHEKYRLEKNTVMISSSAETIKKIINLDLASIAYAKGVSNHMGSRATENLKIMETIFKELKRRNLYFLDSLVSSKSVCSELAKKMGIGFAKRDVFLDNKENPAYIKEQILRLKLKARIRGQAIGIGHDRRVTLGVLEEMMPQLEKEGYKFVFVSELVK